MRSLPTLIGAGLLAGSGLVQSHVSSQGRSTGEAAVAAARLEKVPLTVGDWVGQTLPLSENQVRLGQIAGYSQRRYENQRSGATVSALIVCGRPGPISVHTPEACYGGIGYVPLDERVPCVVLDPHPAEFWRLELRKPSPLDGGYLRVLYAWNVAGTWQAPTGDPRLIYAHAPFLYKLYLVREMREADEPVEGDPCLALARTLLPELGRVLFPGP